MSPRDYWPASVHIDVGGSTPTEAAETFWQVLDEYRNGLGTLYIMVGDTSIPLNPQTGKAISHGTEEGSTAT